MFQPLKLIFEYCVQQGNLEVVSANRKIYKYGDGSGPLTRVRLSDRRLERQLAFFPQRTLGEAFMDGRFIVEEGSIYSFLELIVKGAVVDRQLPWWANVIDTLRLMSKRIQQFNPIFRSRRNVSHHYDIKSEIYDLFLDADRQYSCAYFENGSGDLETAQLAKKRHLAAKLALKPGQHVLDIGSGWGGLSMYLAKNLGVKVTGITLSTEQYKYARRKARQRDLSGVVNFQLQDYRQLASKFDRIVSVGMFEHVGVNHYNTYFRKIYDLLTDDGVALIHTIGRGAPPGVTDPFIARYIFPGGYIPSLSEVVPAIEKSGLIMTDLEVLRYHYAYTLRHWRERFLSKRDRAVSVMDEKFCKMWEYYLSAAETGFRFQKLVVYQIQLTKRLATLPVTRNYIKQEEDRLSAPELRPDQRDTG